MKKLVLGLCTFLTLSQVFGQSKTILGLETNKPNQTILDIEFGALNQTKVGDDSDNQIKFSFDQSISLQKKGAPEVPYYSISIMSPNQTKAHITILESDSYEINDVNMSPSKGHITRNINPNNIPYIKGEEYQEDVLFPQTNIFMNPSYMFRDIQGQALHIFPVQYNPISKVTKVYKHLKIRINYESIGSEVNEYPKKITDDFDGLYAKHFVNYNKQTRYSPIKEVGSLLVICPATYLNSIQPFVKWKQMKGIKTYLVNADTITGGITEVKIAELVKWYYDNHQIAYLQIVGDHQDIPAKSASTTLFGSSDIAYAYITNSDHYPELIVGRFSGNSVAEIETQVQRTLEYEQTPNTAGTWMGTQIGISSEQGTGDDNQYDYEHIHDIVDSNKNQYNYVTNVELYDGNPARGGTDIAGYPDATMLSNAINNGSSLINYAGHGASDGIVTCQFTKSEIPSLTNTSKLPFILVVGCQPGNFINQTSFAEDIERFGGTNPKGSISNFMSTVDQYWNEPMEAQDEINAVMRGARVNNLRNRLGALCISGCMQMNDKYNTFSDPTGGSDMTDTWVFFGDPTVSLFNKFEGTLSVSNSVHLQLNQTNYSISCPVDGALIGLYYQNAYLASAYVSGGVANFTFPPLTSLDTIYITATKQNYVPTSAKSIVVNWPASVSSQDFNNSIIVSPNPVNSFLNITTKNNQIIQSINVLDMTGKIVKSENLNSNSFKMNTESIAKGIYMLDVHTSEGIYKSKFAKQ